MTLKPSFVAGFCAFVVAAMFAGLRPTPYDNYVWLAQALLHGHVWLNCPCPGVDALQYSDGRYYNIEAPLPALMLMPFVAIYGSLTNQTILSVVLAGIAVGATWELGERLGVRASINAWICAFFFVGTDLLWCAMFGDVWLIAHVSAVCFTMLALVELAGKRRPWLVAVWAACAFESRFSMLLVIPAYVILCIFNGAAFRIDAGRLRAVLAQFAFVLVPVAALWGLYNYVRWGTWNDVGYLAWYHQDAVGNKTGSPIQLRYLSYELWSFFVQAPQVSPSFPFLNPSYSGVALTWTSPALVFAFLARRPRLCVVGLWAATVLTAIPNVLYYVNGGAQFGMRHALDFEPFLVALMLLAARKALPIWASLLIAYSCIVGLWGCWFWLTFLRLPEVVGG